MTGGLWIVDTNIVVSGVIASDARSPVAVILDRMLAARVRFALCEELVAEYRQVLLRPRIQRVHGFNEDAVDRLLEVLIVNAVIRDIAGRAEHAPDPDDHHLWRLLTACSGAGLVTGDRLLLQRPPRDVAVVTSRQFLELAD